MRRTARFSTWLLGVSCLLVGTAAAADWLVLRDGSRIEVKGAWKVSGKQIVFTEMEEGRLSSIRGDLVDLDASARATEEALHAPDAAVADPSGVETKPKARWSFSDKDFTRAAAVEEPSVADGGEDGAEGAKAPPAPKSDLDVVVWSQSVEPARNRIKVSGTLLNGGKNMAASVVLEVQLIDRQGVVVGAQSAVLQRTSLAPGETSDFSTTFPQIVTYEKVKFEPKASMFKIDAPDATAEKEEKSGPIVSQ